MATKVNVTYTPSLNISITKKGGRITKVTSWTTGIKGSTHRETA